MRTHNVFFSTLLAAMLAATSAFAAPIDTGFTYQGELRQSNVPANGAFDFRARIYDASAGGAQVGSELLRNEVAVSAGLFDFQLDIGIALVQDRQLYLELDVRPGASSGAYTALTPRQKLTLTPAAGYALAAGTSAEALSLATENVLVVSPSGAPFTTVGAALAAVSAPGPANRYLIDVGPGIYVESSALNVPGYVHVRGAGRKVSVLRSSRTAASPSPAAATIELSENASLSDIGIENNGTGTFDIGVYLSTPVTRATRIENVDVLVNGAGGTGHYAVFLNDAEPTIRNSSLRASGANGFGTAVNAALGSVNISGGFPRPLIENSTLIGGLASDSDLGCSGNTGTGFGFQGTNSAPEFFGSYLCGDRRGVFVGVNGIARIADSRVLGSSTSGSFLIETTASAAVLIRHSQVSYVGNKYTGTGGLVCTQNVLANHSAASDGTTSATACN